MSDRPKWLTRSVTEMVIPASGQWFACFGSWDPRDLVVWPVLAWAVQRREQARNSGAQYDDLEWKESDYPNRAFVPIVSTPHSEDPWPADDIGDFMESRDGTWFEFLGTFRDDMSPGLREEFLARFEAAIARTTKEAADATQ